MNGFDDVRKPIVYTAFMNLSLTTLALLPLATLAGVGASACVEFG